MTIEERLKRIISEWIDVDPLEVVPEAKFTDDLGADSLSVVELVMAIEEEFGIEISDENAEKLHRVGDVIRYLEERVGGE